MLNNHQRRGNEDDAKRVKQSFDQTLGELNSVRDAYPEWDIHVEVRSKMDEEPKTVVQTLNEGTTYLVKEVNSSLVS